ncbi:MAG: stage II sporulation protein M [Phycisphaerae bacterium]|nr:stage II sporulation protein M [Phycisphaerae bacterium]
MIIDLERFIAQERPTWDELEHTTAMIEAEPGWSLNLKEAQRLHYLFERAAAALARINTFSSDPEVTQYLESLVARTYAAIHSLDRKRTRFSPIGWFFGTFPRTFRKHFAAFLLAAAVTLAGVAFGGGIFLVDPDSKQVMIPAMFSHAYQSPSERVAEEEAEPNDRIGGHRNSFAAMLMANNIRVSMIALALGFTFGIGTITLLFYNGVILGVIVVDYIVDGQGVFLTGWLLPHGSIEIPAILLAAQAGFILSSAMIGHGTRDCLKARMRQAVPSIVTLIFGVAIMLVWAGVIESFLSQYHEPVIPYSLKITFGVVQLVMLAIFLGLSGRQNPQYAEDR